MSDELTPAEKELIDLVTAALEGRCFDTTTILAIAESDCRLAAALDALVPMTSYKQQRRRFRLVHCVLTAMAERNPFDIDRFGWWYARGLASHVR